MPSGKRRAYFRHASARAGKVFTPDMVLTFHCFDHSYNYHAFRMSVPPCFSLDMVRRGVGRRGCVGPGHAVG
jgi:hypothetical protein